MELTARIIAVALFLSTVETWMLRRSAWPWALMRGELPRLVWPFVDERGLPVLLVARAAAALALLAGVHHVAIPAFLLASTLLLALRWRGSMNGGSDFMTLVVLSALTVATAWPRPAVRVGASWWIAIQACNSYFVAGVVKLRARAWREGRALPAFLAGAVHAAPPLPWPRAASWAVMLLECSFPLALWRPEACVVLCGLALAFHVANVYVFGLNRFVWAWAATYPALYAVSGKLFGY